MFGKFKVLLLAFVFILPGCIQDMEGKQENAVIPRKALFGNPDIVNVDLSDDGKYISYLAPLNGVLNIYLAEVGDINNARPITNDTHRGIRSYLWSYNNENILYLQDNNGDENFAVYSLDIKNGKVVQLTEKPHKAFIVGTSPSYKDEVLIGINARRPEYFDIYKVNIVTGRKELILENNEFISVLADNNLKLRFGIKTTQEGWNEVYKFSSDMKAELFDKIEPDDTLTTTYIDFNKEGDKIYLLDSRGRDKSALFEMDVYTKKKRLIAEDGKADISSLIIHPTQRHVQAVASNYQKVKYQILDNSIKSDFDYLSAIEQGELRIISRTLDDKKWIVVYLSDKQPLAYYIYDRPSQRADFLFFGRKKLTQYKLKQMESVIIRARDGLEMVSYLTRADENKPMPLVLYVHGGPRVRDSWGYNSTHQWLANRGYSVLSVNYRGSTGFGKGFTNKGDGQWAAKMHEDLIDAVNWAIEKKITTPGQVAIMGASYGGYATLVGLTFTPDTFACGIDVVGPSNLVTFIQSVPPYWKPAKAALVKMIGGDIDNKEGLELAKAKSPITYVDRIKKPLLIAHGANDPRVKQDEADQIVEAMKAKNIPASYILFPDEGHGFARPENMISFNAIVELFLHRCLGGKVEEIGTDFDNSSLRIMHGKEYLNINK